MKKPGEIPGQGTFAFVPQVLPRGDGSYVVTPGRPQEWVTIREAAALCRMEESAVRKWAHDPRAGLVVRRVGRRKLQIEAASLLKATAPWEHLR